MYLGPELHKKFKRIHTNQLKNKQKTNALGHIFAKKPLVVLQMHPQYC